LDFSFRWFLKYPNKKNGCRRKICSSTYPSPDAFRKESEPEDGKALAVKKKNDVAAYCPAMPLPPDSAIKLIK
jgi:hypothetical protein